MPDSRDRGEGGGDVAGPGEVAGLAEVAGRLYGLRPDHFTAGRTAETAAARASGDRALARAVGSLRRPTVAAWTVNLLVRERADLVRQLVSLGDSLRQAQSRLQGDALRELGRQRRQLVAAVTAEARSLAAAQGQALAEASARQVEETLQAALADPVAADAVLSGVLVAPLSSTGLDAVAEALAVSGRGTATGGAGGPAPEDGGSGGGPALRVVEDEDRPRRVAQEAVAAAGELVGKAARKRDKAQRRRAKAQARVLQVEAGLEELRRQVAEAEAQAEAACAELAEAEERLTGAEADLATARRTAEEAAAALARHR